MARLLIEDREDGRQISKVAANIAAANNRQGMIIFGIKLGANNSLPQDLNVLRDVT
jgi:hypothetical protein